MALEKTDKIWHNGKLIRWEDATIHVMSHVVHYGSSVFEGIRCYAPNGSGSILAGQIERGGADSQGSAVRRQSATECG